MNKTALRGLAAAIIAGTLAKRKRNPIGFNVSPYFAVPESQLVPGACLSSSHEDKTGHHCGTVACIAGWAYILAGGRSRKPNGIHKGAQKVLGLTDIQASQLFCPGHVRRSTITQQEAALVIYHFAETGKVNWDITAR